MLSGHEAQRRRHTTTSRGVLVSWPKPECSVRRFFRLRIALVRNRLSFFVAVFLLVVRKHCYHFGSFLVEESRSQCRQWVPVIILTSSIQGRDMVRRYGLAANSCIQEPVDLDQFRITVKRVGIYWLVVNQAPVTAEARSTKRSLRLFSRDGQAPTASCPALQTLSKPYKRLLVVSSARVTKVPPSVTDGSAILSR